MDLKEINPNITIDHWYYKTKYVAAKEMLYESEIWTSNSNEHHIIADIGAGSAIFTRAFYESLRACFKSAYAVDIYYEDDLLGKRDGIYFVKTLPSDILPNHLFFMDVLEHIEDDVNFLRNWVNESPEGSSILITVPAFQSLWSNHDIFLDHKRRYNLKEIEEVVVEAGLTILQSRYLFGILFPLVFLVRKMVEPVAQKLGFKLSQGIKPTNSLFNFLLNMILGIEISLFPFNKLVGISCMVLARKS